MPGNISILMEVAVAESTGYSGSGPAGGAGGLVYFEAHCWAL